MYRRVSLFLLIVFLVICTFSGTTLYCYNMLVNNEKVEDASLYTNIIQGWDYTIGTPPVIINPYYYVEPIGQMIFATDANDNYMYAYGDGERFYKEGTNEFVKDKENNYIYASAGDATYHYLYYATSTDTNYEYMFADNRGGQYYTFKKFDGPVTLMKTDKNQPIINDKEELNKQTDVNFNKDAKVYYVVILVASGIGIAVLISLLVVFIRGKIKENKILKETI